MPVNVVKTKKDEQEWEQAKESAKRQGKATNWAYVMGIFERMKHHIGGGKKK